MNLSTMLLAAVCVTVSGALLYRLWTLQPGSLAKKLLWSIVICVPLCGWVFYGGFYSPLSESAIKAEGGASGWKPWMK